MDRLKDMLTARQFIAMYIVCTRFGYSIEHVALNLEIHLKDKGDKTIFRFRGVDILTEKYQGILKMFVDQNNNIVEI